MFPHFSIWEQQFFFTWIGMAISLVFFIIWLYRYSEKYNLNFWKIFNWIWVFILLPYILWRYFYDLFEYHFIVPNDFLELLSPFGYNFSFVWLSIWFWLAVVFFLKNINYSQEKKKRIDIIFFSLMRGLFVLWFFLVLWDDFHGISTDSIFWVNALIQDSNISSLEKVRPVWLFVSLMSLLLFIFTKLLLFYLKNHWVWIIWFMLMFLWFYWIFWYQSYNKHLLFWLIDVKLLFCLLSSIFVLIVYYLLVNRKDLR